MQVYRYVDGADSPGGSFTLSFEGSSTAPIAWNATAISMEAALESLPQVGDVAVSLDPATSTSTAAVPFTAMAWLVEFTTLGTPPNLGNLSLLVADGSYLTGTGVGVTAEKVSSGCCTVELSANAGVDYTSLAGSKNDIPAFRYQDRAAVRAVIPSAGPASGDTRVVLVGTGFDLPSSASPGAAGVRSNNVVCVFGGQLESRAIRLNSTAVICTSPSSPRLRATVMSIAVKWPASVVPSLTTAAFAYYEDVSLKALRPRQGSNFGGYTVVASVGRGSFAAVGVNATCIVEVRIPSNLTAGYNSLEFITPAASASRSDFSSSDVAADIAHTWTSNEEAYSCEIPGIGDFFHGVAADDWVEGDWGAVAHVSLSGNKGVDRTAPRIFTYTPRPIVRGAYPLLGGDGGGTMVTVHGGSFTPPPGGFEEDELLCRFGHAAPVSARQRSQNAVECIAPPHTNDAAELLIVVGGASVFHATQEVILRIPSPAVFEQSPATSSSQYEFEHRLVSGTWSLRLEGVETDLMYANVTAGEMALALSTLPNVGNVSVSVERRTSTDLHAGLFWNETAFTVHFVTRGGVTPIMSTNTSDLSVSSSATPAEVDEEEGLMSSSLRPQVDVRFVENGHDGHDVVREVQVLRTNRSALSAEVQTVTVTTMLPPTAEVRSLATYTVGLATKPCACYRTFSFPCHVVSAEYRWRSYFRVCTNSTELEASGKKHVHAFGSAHLVKYSDTLLPFVFITK